MIRPNATTTVLQAVPLLGFSSCCCFLLQELCPHLWVSKSSPSLTASCKFLLFQNLKFITASLKDRHTLSDFTLAFVIFLLAFLLMHTHIHFLLLSRCDVLFICLPSEASWWMAQHMYPMNVCWIELHWMIRPWAIGERNSCLSTLILDDVTHV